MATAAPAVRQVSVDELIALADEIAALSRTGLPLETGLASVRRALPRRLRQAVGDVAARLQRGESLDETLAQIKSPLAPLLRTVVEAGLRAGRLPAALEELSRVARLRAELRRQTLFALIYPLVILVMAYLVLGFFVLAVLPRLAGAFDSLRLPVSSASRVFLDLEQLPPAVWLALTAAVFLVPSLLWWLLPKLQFMAWRKTGARRSRVPVYGRLFSDAQASYFAALLGLFVDQHMPLPQALRLTGKATGNRALAAEAERAAARLERGEPLRGAVVELESLPAAFTWSLVAAESAGQLGAVLKRSAESYHERASWKAESLRTLLPVMLIVGVAGLATLVCALVLFYPWTSILNELGDAILEH